MRPATDWDSLRGFARAFAERIAADQPQEYLGIATKARRHGKIFIDYLRNGRGATAVCSYSLRNRPGAPIATPLSWEELPRVRASDQFGSDGAWRICGRTLGRVLTASRRRFLTCIPERVRARRGRSRRGASAAQGRACRAGDECRPG